MANQDPVLAIQQQFVAIEPQFRQLSVAAGRNVDYHREVSFALSKAKENSFLAKCPAESFREAFENLGSMGLSLNPSLGQAALIPRWNAKRGCMWVTAQPMYRGYIALATGGSKIKNVWGAVVLEDDVFEMELGSNPKIRHVPKIVRGADKASRVPNVANVIGAYVIAEVAGATHPHATWMDIDDILKIAERSESYNPKDKTKKPSGPWMTDFGQMCVKTVFRRAYKTWPGVDTQEYKALQEAVRVDTEAEIMEHTPRGDAVDQGKQAGGVLVITEDQAKELEKLALKKKCRPATVCKAYGVESFAALPSDKFDEVKTRINAFGSKK